ncbi:MAG TPA: cupin domain-containing protein [Sedimenticola sp.]|nr:cupin domain-containing protein [Sedimenticola sp.]
MNRGNLFDSIPDDLPDEVFTVLAEGQGARIERILSHGQASPASGWYDQAQDEWVMVLKGAARLAFEQGGETGLGPGDHILIPARCRHRVTWTDPATVTVWLAVFF